MRSIRPQKLGEGTRVWRPEELDAMSPLEREMHEVTAQQKREKAKKGSSSVFDLIDPFGIFDLKTKADNLNRDIQKGIEGAIDETVIKPVKSLFEPKTAQSFMGQEWEKHMQWIAGS